MRPPPSTRPPPSMRPLLSMRPLPSMRQLPSTPRGTEKIMNIEYSFFLFFNTKIHTVVRSQFRRVSSPAARGRRRHAEEVGMRRRKKAARERRRHKKAARRGGAADGNGCPPPTVAINSFQRGSRGRRLEMIDQDKVYTGLKGSFRAGKAANFQIPSDS